MSGVALPMKLAIAPVIDVASDWRPTLTVKKGPVTSNITVFECSSVTDSMINFQGFIPPNDMTCIRRNLTLHYKPLVLVQNVPGWLMNLQAENIPVIPTCPFGQGQSVEPTYQNPRTGGACDVCIPLPANLRTSSGVSFSDPVTCGLPVNDPAPQNPAWSIQWSPGCWVPGLAMRSLPLQSICSSIVLNINGTSITFPAQDVAPLFPYMNWIDLSRTQLSTVPFYPSEGPFFAEPDGAGPPCLLWDIPFRWTYAPTAGIMWGVGGQGLATIPASTVPEPNAISVPAFSTTSGYGTQINPYGQSLMYFAQVQQMYTSGGRAISWRLLQAETTMISSLAIQRHLPAYNMILEADIYEDIAVGPFRLGDASEETGIMRVNNLSLQLNFNNPTQMLALASSLTQQWPGDLTDTIVDTDHRMPVPFLWASAWKLSASLVSQKLPVSQVTFNAFKPTLEFQLNTADPITMARFPNFIILPTEIYQSYITSSQYTVPVQSLAATLAAPPEAQRITLPAIRSTFIPNKLIIYFSRDRGVNISTRYPVPVQPPTAFPGYPYAITTGSTGYDQSIVDAKTSNHYLRITNVSINAFDRVALLSTLTEPELHKMSQRNGYKGSLAQWTGEWGSILIIDMAEDLCLGTAMAAGQNTNSNIQITVTVQPSCMVKNLINPETFVPFYRNPALRPAALPGYMTLTYSATQLLVFNGSCVIGAGQMTVTQEGPTEAQVLRLLQVEKSRMKTSEIPKQLTAGSLTQEKLMTSSAGGEDADDDEAGRLKRSRH